MTTQKPQNAAGSRASRQALMALGALVLFGVLLEQAATLMGHLLHCLAGHLAQALPWVFVQACHRLADLPDLSHLLMCYNLLATAGPVVHCALGMG